MTGYWSGTGTIRLSGKETERVKCVAVYRVGKGGTEIKQTLRCASSDYNINAKADLAIKGGSRWKATGRRRPTRPPARSSGRYTGWSFVLAIKGANFTAAMNVGLSNCKQSIEITPKGLEMRRISMNLVQVLTTPAFPQARSHAAPIFPRRKMVSDLVANSPRRSDGENRGPP